MIFLLLSFFSISFVAITIAVKIVVVVFAIVVAIYVCVGVCACFSVDVSIYAVCFCCRNSFGEILITFITVNIVASVNGSILNFTKYLILLIYVIIWFCGGGGGGLFIRLIMLIIPLLITFTLN